MIKYKILFCKSILYFLCVVIYLATLSTAMADQSILSDSDVYANETSNTIIKEERPNSIKIWGGTESKIGDWPWMAALLSSANPDAYQAQFCAGVLIGKSWILTAAHCAYGKSPGNIEVAVGVYDLKSSSVTRIQVKKMYIHPQYNNAYSQNDIALLELKQSSTQPIMPLFAEESKEGVPASLIGQMTTAIGWGMANGSSYPYYPEKLRQVDLPVVSNSYCNNIYAPPYLLSSQICAGYYEGKDACGGDSGGPIISKIDDTWVHVGLVSYGAPCEKYFGWYGVYTRTSSYIDFIKQYVPDVAIHPNKPKGLPWLMLLLTK